MSENYRDLVGSGENKREDAQMTARDQFPLSAEEGSHSVWILATTGMTIFASRHFSARGLHAGTRNWEASPELAPSQKTLNLWPRDQGDAPFSGI